MALIESNPADIKGMSARIVEPASLEAVEVMISINEQSKCSRLEDVEEIEQLFVLHKSDCGYTFRDEMMKRMVG